MPQPKSKSYVYIDGRGVVMGALQLLLRTRRAPPFTALTRGSLAHSIDMGSALSCERGGPPKNKACALYDYDEMAIWLLSRHSLAICWKRRYNDAAIISYGRRSINTKCVGRRGRWKRYVRYISSVSPANYAKNRIKYRILNLQIPFMRHICSTSRHSNSHASYWS